MALIICKECQREYSDKAPACPQCGCPTKFNTAEPAQEPKKAYEAPASGAAEAEPDFAQAQAAAEAEERAFLDTLPYRKKPRRPTLFSVVLILLVALGCALLGVFAEPVFGKAEMQIPLFVAVAVLTGFTIWMYVLRKKRYQKAMLDYRQYEQELQQKIAAYRAAKEKSGK